MPEFSDICRHYDDTQVFDAYGATFLFLAQFSTFNETSLDGSIVKKRTMSVATDVPFPARRVIAFENEKWIVGDGNIDMFQNVAVRANYWMKKVTDSGVISTPGQVLQATQAAGVWTIPGNQAYVNLEYRKDTVNSVDDSEYDPFWDVYTAPNEQLVSGMFLSMGGKLFRVRTAHIELNGLLQSACDQLDEGALVEVMITTNAVYDPVTQETTGQNQLVVGVMLDYYMSFEYMTQADIEQVKGDKTLYLPSAVKVGADIMIGDQPWRVVGNRVDKDAYAHHIRRAD